MSTPSQLSFLPDDYLERKAQRRASLICGVLFVCVMGGLASAFWLSEQATDRLDQEVSAVDQQYINEANRIKQVNQMQERQRRMAHQAEITSSLLERAPRSRLLAEYTNTLPAGVSLLDLTLDSKLITPAAPGPVAGKTAFEQKKAAQPGAPRAANAPPPLPEARQYDVHIKIAGLAMNDGQVAKYIENLSRSPLFKDVNLVITEEHVVEKQPMRKFEMEMTVNPAADAQLLDAAAGPGVERVAGTSEGGIQ